MSRRNSLTRAKVRIRRDSGSKLDYYHKIINKTILNNQVIYFIKKNMPLKLISTQFISLLKKESGDWPFGCIE
jgi:hypothetical protein